MHSSILETISKLISPSLGPVWVMALSTLIRYPYTESTSTSNHSTLNSDIQFLSPLKLNGLRSVSLCLGTVLEITLSSNKACVDEDSNENLGHPIDKVLFLYTQVPISIHSGMLKI